MGDRSPGSQLLQPLLSPALAGSTFYFTISRGCAIAGGLAPTRDAIAAPCLTSQHPLRGRSIPFASLTWATYTNACIILQITQQI